jgi:Tfp pilus assembly protein PilV
MSLHDRARQDASKPSADRTPAEPQAGFTIVEIIAAILILTVGVLGLAGTTAYTVRQVTFANVMTERSVAQQTVIEKLNAMSFADVGSGSDSVGKFTVTWSSATETSASKLVTIITSGPGLSTAGNSFPSLANSVADTFVYRVITR